MKIPTKVNIVEEHKLRKKFGFVNWFKYKFMKKKIILTRMYLRSGKLIERFVSATGNFFEYKKETYFITKDDMIYNTRYKLMELVYYQGIPEPVNVSVRKNFHPRIDSSALSKAIKFEYAKNLLSASKLQKNVDLALLFSALSMVASIITVILVVRATGVI